MVLLPASFLSGQTPMTVDSLTKFFLTVTFIVESKNNVISQLSIKKKFRINNFVSNRNSTGTRTSTE